MNIIIIISSLPQQLIVSARFAYHTLLNKVTGQLLRLSLVEETSYMAFNLTCSPHFGWLTVCVQWQLLFDLVLHDPKHLAPPAPRSSRVRKLPTKEILRKFVATDNHAAYLI